MRRFRSRNRRRITGGGGRRRGCYPSGIEGDIRCHGRGEVIRFGTIRVGKPAGEVHTGLGGGSGFFGGVTVADGLEGNFSAAVGFKGNSQRNDLPTGVQGDVGSYGFAEVIGFSAILVGKPTGEVHTGLSGIGGLRRGLAVIYRLSIDRAAAVAFEGDGHRYGCPTGVQGGVCCDGTGEVISLGAVRVGKPTGEGHIGLSGIGGLRSSLAFYNLLTRDRAATVGFEGDGENIQHGEGTLAVGNIIVIFNVYTLIFNIEFAGDGPICVGIVGYYTFQFRVGGCIATGPSELRQGVPLDDRLIVRRDGDDVPLLPPLRDAP